MLKLADTTGNNGETSLSNPAVAVGRPDFQAFASLPKGVLHTAAGTQPGMRIPPEDFQRLASSHPDANIRARAQLVLDVAQWRANKAAAAGSQTLEKAAMTTGNKYLEKIASYGVFAKNTAEDIFSRTPAGLEADLSRYKEQRSAARDARYEAEKEWRDTGKGLDRLGKISTDNLTNIGKNVHAIQYTLSNRGWPTSEERYNRLRARPKSGAIKEILSRVMR